MSIQTITFYATGSDQTFTVPPFVEEIRVKAWGAGGGWSQSLGTGGPGGYSTGTLPVTSGQVLNIMVGQAGVHHSPVTTYGGGGAGGTDVSWMALHGSSGGGRSGISINSGSQLIIAGGGGGSACATAQSVWSNGGAGGGSSGTDAWVNGSGNPNGVGRGGTQISGGAGGISYWSPNANGFAGTAFQGGTGGNTSDENCGGGGGGGGGYYGGGGGSGQWVNTGTEAEQDLAGGGGSGYIDPFVLNGFTDNTPQNTNGNTNPTFLIPPNTSDTNYVSGIGMGGSSDNPSGDGLIVLIYDQPDLIMNKSTNTNFADINSTLAYEVTVNNSSPTVTITNINFIDTIPNGTTLVQNSLTLNGTPIPGTTNPPGITISSIAPGATSTVQFSVKVFPTTPNPNTLYNSATSSYTGGFIFNSNVVTTTINNATLTSLKSSSKYFATVGNTIIYTITIANSGSVTANNVLLVDTIVNSVTLVSGSFIQDGTPISGNPNPPGVILPKPIAPQSTSTITYQVTVITIPSPNPILNSASQIFTYTINPNSSPNITNTSTSNSNTTSTTINYAVLTSSKIVNKDFVTCGDILSYTITLSNLGNTTAVNVFFTDTPPNGTTLVPNSVIINGTTIPGANPTAGITIPSIGSKSTTTINFKAQVSC